MSDDTARSLGARAEAVVARYLEERGYEIVGLNVRIGHLELDVVARSGGVIAVVEVRTRGPGAWTSAFGSINQKKRERVRRAGQRLWQRRFRHDPSALRMRFDVAAVSFETREPQVEYVQAAF